MTMTDKIDTYTQKHIRTDKHMYRDTITLTPKTHTK